jgi:hypothetical protein
MPPEQVWSNPYVRKNIPPDLRARVERLFADREMFYQALDARPQVIGHYDLHRRNLLIRPREDGRELVAIDWPNTGLGALGAEFYGLLGAGSIVFEIDGFYLPTYDRALFPAFLAGLRDGGWRGPEEEIRLAYTAWLALWLGPLPMSMALWTAPDMLDAGRRQFGCGPDEYAAELVYAFRYALDCADEARAILG